MDYYRLRTVITPFINDLEYTPEDLVSELKHLYSSTTLPQERFWNVVSTYLRMAVKPRGQEVVSSVYEQIYNQFGRRL